MSSSLLCSRFLDIRQYRNILQTDNILIAFDRFYFPGMLVGPYLDFASYSSLIDETLFTTRKGKEKVPTQGRRIPKGRKRVAYRKMVEGLGFLGLYVTLIGRFNFEVTLADWFETKSLLYR